MMKLKKWMKKMKITDNDWYWELLEEQHAHDVVVTESRKENDDGDGRSDK